MAEQHQRALTRLGIADGDAIGLDGGKRDGRIDGFSNASVPRASCDVATKQARAAKRKARRGLQARPGAIALAIPTTRIAAATGT
ncbi:hypothetical protein, partial [Acinetobacter baumannii]|uniref:hypothetical protein n=1 Tax=Acinetobacter baumannii TaxID=470 RepID=UPI001C08BA51